MRTAYFVGAKGLVLHGRRVLILRRSAGESMPPAWEFPGGGLEDGESLPQCFIREVGEETGLAISQPHIIEATPYISSARKPTLLAYYRAEALSGAVTLSPEHCDFRWATRAEAEGLLLPIIVETLSAGGIWEKLGEYID